MLGSTLMPASGWFGLTFCPLVATGVALVVWLVVAVGVAVLALPPLAHPVRRTVTARMTASVIRSRDGWRILRFPPFAPSHG